MKKSIWRKIHTYVAIFFLPFMLLFAATGVGHLLGFNQFAGASKQSFIIDMPHSSDKLVLKEAIVENLAKHNLAVPGRYERMRDGRMIVGNAKYVASLGKKEDKMVLEYTERTWFGTMYAMHFGNGSDLFNVLSIIFSAFIIVMYLSGFIITSWCKSYQKPAIISLVVGSIIVIACYFQAINI